MSHTPGPWKTDENGNVVRANADGTTYLLPDGWPDVVAEIYKDDDARLIAAAPELLEALRVIRDLDYPSLLTPSPMASADSFLDAIRDTARAAIAKATEPA